MTKIHDNDFSLKMAGVSNFAFELKEFCITHGQPWGGITVSSNAHGANFTVKAGRSNSKATAEWFIKQLAGGSCLGDSSSSAVPHELNFAFIGTMSFQHTNQLIKCENVIIAQGHSTRNTWWLGGPKMSGMDTPMGGMIKSPTQNITRYVTFAEMVGYISHMDMGVISL